MQAARASDSVEHYMLRWLRARNFDVDEADKMIREHLIWRSSEDTDSLTSLRSHEAMDVDQATHDAILDLYRHWVSGTVGRRLLVE